MKKMEFKVGDRCHAVPDGEYEAILIEVQENQRFNKKQLDFRFELKNKDVVGNIVRGFVNISYDSFSAHTKLYKWHQAVTGEDLEPGCSLNIDVFMDKVLLVKVETNTSRKTKNKFSNVTEIKRVIYEL